MDSSDSDFNCSDLITDSDSEKMDKKQSRESDNSDSVLADDKATQQMINAQILRQLHSISKRLEKFKESQCKKTTDLSKIKNETSKQVSNDKGKNHHHKTWKNR